MMAVLNTELMDFAAWKLMGEREKRAFVPPGGDPSQGGDPAMGGGMPPMDPSAAGATGLPPGMDPSMMAPPMMAPPPPAAPPAAPLQGSLPAGP